MTETPGPNPPHHALDGITVLERGWLSSNNVLLHGGDAGAVLVDASHVLHAQQTVALVRHALAGAPLARIVNTHLHSDHCGGNAALAAAFGAPITIPPGHADEVARWDESALTYADTGQLCARFAAADTIAPGASFEAGGRRWEAVAAPGHDPHALMYFDPRDGVLIAADALWENGFGVVFPELDGEEAFADVAAVLDTIERLAPRTVIPGHGRPFDDAAGALARARARLAAFRADPLRHQRHGIKVMVKYHLMEQRRERLADFDRWFDSMPLARRVFDALGRPAATRIAFGRVLLADLAAAGAVSLEGDAVADRAA